MSTLFHTDIARRLADDRLRDLRIDRRRDALPAARRSPRATVADLLRAALHRLPQPPAAPVTA